MVKRIGVLLLVLIAVLPLSAHAQTAGGSWQVYTIANGLREWTSYDIAPDGAGGVWVGHVAGGRGIFRQGGLSHIRADGSSQVYTDEPFQSCPSVDALAATPDGGLWMWLSGYHDYGQNDYQGQRCLQNYGVQSGLASQGFSYAPTIALGYIGPDGVPQMVPKGQLPTNMAAGLAVDAYGRAWVGTTNGAAVREGYGTWRNIAVWNDGSTTSAVYAAGPTIMLGSSNGSVATVATHAGGPDQISVLPRPTSDTGTYVSDIAAGDSIGVIIGRQFYRWDGTAWNAIALPIPAQFGPDEQIYGQTVAYTGGTFWVGAPQYGLYRLDGNSWTAIPAGSTPLPSPSVNDVVAANSTTLLIATYDGAAQLNTGGPAPDPSKAQAAFDALWQRTNRNAQGSWVWGPRAWAERYEGYREGPGGYRFVRYYDKTRMEVSDPQADPNSPWYVTNGLLVMEMVKGRAQFSNDPALSQCPFYVNGGTCSSGTRVAGDIGPSVNNPAPYYGVFGDYLAGVERRGGQRVSATLRETSPGNFALGQEAALGTEPTTLDAYDETTQHNIPRAFWNYMRAQPIDWLYTFGHPITEPYWIRATIGGNEQWVMVQLFERRTLTYTPANQPPWQVEMGNVGQHYYQWRYGAYENPPWEQ